MLTISNTLSLLRIPAALLFLVDNVYVRLSAIALAMLSDCLDGYLARKRKTVTQLGAVLDPMMDKFFNFFVLTVLVFEHQLELWQMAAIISRDFFLCIFALYLSLVRAWDKYRCRSYFWGKLTTVCQFLVVILIVTGVVIPDFVLLLFIPLGIFTTLELYLGYRQTV